MTVEYVLIVRNTRTDTGDVFFVFCTIYSDADYLTSLVIADINRKKVLIARFFKSSLATQYSTTYYRMDVTVTLSSAREILNLSTQSQSAHISFVNLSFRTICTISLSNLL